jgi:hypothetical protein
MATYPNLLTPLTNQSIVPMGLQIKPYNLDKLYDAARTTNAAGQKAAAAPKAKAEGDDKLPGLHGAATATYDAIQKETAVQGSLMSTFGEQAFSLPEFSASVGRQQKLQSSYHNRGLELDLKQHETMRENVNKNEAGDFVNIDAFFESGGKDIRTNDEILDYHQYVYTPGFNKSARQYSWNASTETEKDANEEVAKIFAPAMDKLNATGTSWINSANYGDVYGIRTSHSEKDNNHTALQQAAMQAYEQAGFVMTSALDKNGNLIKVADRDKNNDLIMDINLARNSPMKGFIQSFLSSQRGNDGFYSNEDGSLNMQKFAPDYAAFVEERLQAEWNKRKQKSYDKTQSFSESNEATARAGREKDMLVEVQAPGIQFTGTIQGKGAAWSDADLMKPNGIQNLIGGELPVVSNGLFQKMRLGQATPEEKDLFFRSPKDPTQLAEMEKSTGIGGANMLNLKVQQDLYNKQVIDQAVKVGVLEKTLDENGNIAYVTNEKAKENVERYLADANTDPVTANRVAKVYDKIKASGDISATLQRALPRQSAQTSTFLNTEVISKETPILADMLKQSWAGMGNDAKQFADKAVIYSKGLATRWNFDGINATIINQGQNMSIAPNVKPSNLYQNPQTGVMGCWKQDRNGNYLPAVPAYDIRTNADGRPLEMEYLTKGTPEFDAMQALQAQNPGNVLYSTNAAVMSNKVVMTVQEYEQFAKKNSTMMESEAQVPVDKTVVDAEIKRILRDKKGVIPAKNDYGGGVSNATISTDKESLEKDLELTTSQAIIASTIHNNREREIFVAQSRINNRPGGKTTAVSANPLSKVIPLSAHPDYDYKSKSPTKAVTLVEKDGQQFVEIDVDYVANSHLQPHLSKLSQQNKSQYSNMITGQQLDTKPANQNVTTSGQTTGRIVTPNQSASAIRR